MRALVVYESMFGNTAAVAEAIATSLRAQGIEAAASPVSRLAPEHVDEADLLVVGGPTHAHGMSSTATRRSALEDTEAIFHPDAAATPGLREWVRSLPTDSGQLAAAFDTRINKPALATGSAARGIRRRLAHHGYRLITEPESFLVTPQGDLVEGELEHAAAWGHHLAEQATAGVT